MRRRSVIGALAGVTLWPRTTQARDYASAQEVLDTIDGLAASVEAALGAIEKVVPAAQPFAASTRADHIRERADREAIRARRRLPAGLAPVAPATPVSASLDALRATQQELVHAHAEGLPAFDDPAAVQILARHMVEAAQRLTVIDMWIELEAGRAG